jgi:hypothetical protein
MVKKKASKKNIASSMRNLEDAILSKNSKKNKKNNVISKRKKDGNILLLTDIIELSPYKDMNYKLITMKKNIHNIIKSDIENWIKNNMSSITDESIKKSLNTLKYNNK